MTTADPKLRSVETQIHAIRDGKRKSLNCPYCGQVSFEGDLCCGTMLKAVQAVLDRLDLNERIEMAERIAEKAERN